MSGRSIRAGGGFVEIGIRSRIAKGANAVQADLRKLGTKLKSQGKSIMQAGLLAGTTAAGLLAGPVKMASEMQETMGKFDTVFGGAAKSVQAWSEETAAAMGTSRQEMAAMLSGMQDLLVPMGVMPESAEGMSKELSKLAVDLGSFNNLGTDQVMGDLMAAMTGSGEVMKKYGVLLSEAAVKQELVNQGIDPKNADNAAKAQARLNIIMRGTTAAQGDAIRTSGSFANQVKRLKASLVDAATEIGGPILDDLAGMVSVMSQGIGAFREFASENSGLFKTIGLTLAAVSGLGVAMVGIGSTLSVAGFAASGLASAMALAGASVGFLVSPVALALAGVTALGIGLVRYTDLGADAVDWLTERFGPLVDTVMSAGSAIVDALKLGDTQAAWELAMSALELLWLDLTSEIRDIWASAMGFVLDLGSNMAEGLGMLFEGLADTLTAMLSAYEGYYNKVYDSVIEIGGSISGVRTIGGTGNAFQNDFGGAKDGLTETLGQLKTFGEEMKKSAQDQRESRMSQREEGKREREERVATLRADVTRQEEEITTAKKKAETDRSAELDKIQEEVNKKKAELGDGQKGLDEEVKRTGPAGTFSAFAAGVIGSGTTRNEQRENDKLSALKQIAKNTGKAPVGRFG